MRAAKKQRIVFACAASAIAMMAASPSWAQESEGEDVIIVSGIKKALGDAIAVKKEAPNIVDAISAEDIGKFPDENIAESLQRITGVQITRRRGEGQFVSVRGLPSEFNYITLNGASVASASNNQRDQTADRNFDFSILSSEFVSTLEVYKTPMASLEEGAISATINIKTLRPLDIGEQRISLSAQGQYDQNQGGVTPKIVGIYSNTFNDGRVGLALGAVYNKRHLQEHRATTEQYDPFGADGDMDMNIDEGGNVLPVTSGGYYIANVAENGFYDEERERITGLATLQFAPQDNLVLTFDALYSEFEGDGVTSSFTLRPNYGLLYTGAMFTDVAADSNGVLTTVETDDTYTAANNFHKLDKTEMRSFAGEILWTSEDWEVKVSGSSSRSVSSLNEIGFDTLIWAGASFGSAVQAGYDLLDGEPIASMNIGSFDPTDGAAYLNGWIGGNELRREDESLRGGLDITYKVENSIIDSVQTGFLINDRTRTNEAYFHIDYAARGGSMGAYQAPTPLNNYLSAYNGAATTVGDWAYFDPQLYLDDGFSGSLDEWKSVQEGDGNRSVNGPQIYDVTERTLGGYVQVNYGFDGAVPVRGNIGVRFVGTKQSVVNNSVDFDSIVFPVLPMDPVIIPPAEEITFERDYFDVLPSFNLTAEVSPEVLLRAGVAKVMTRPSLDALVPRFSVSVSPNNVSGGNPDLEPFRAWQYDVSAEWYFSPTGMISVAGFYKDIESFIEIGSSTIDIQGETFARTLPVNGSGGTLKGFEVNYIQTYDFLPAPFDGLGAQANVTYVDGHIDANPTLMTPERPFEGLSDWTYNLVLFYEKDGFGARLAYNHRARFLNEDDIRGGGVVSEFTDDYNTLDASISYDVTPNLSVFAEAINLTDEAQIQEASFIAFGGAYPLTYSDTGRRVFFGVRAGF